MTKGYWIKKIRSELEGLKTYNENFNSTIDALAGVLEQRDLVKGEFKKGGSKVLITKTSDRGAENSVINPLITTIDKLNLTALSYWKELGLTPASFKKMNQAIEEKGVSALEKALADMSE